MHLVIVAEGIERGEQATALRGVGCELGQGFFLARPMEAAAFEQLIASTPSLKMPAALA